MSNAKQINTADCIHWHAMDIEEVFSKIESIPEGLTQAEAEQRLLKYGANRLTPPKKRSFVSRFFAQINNVLIYVLLGSALMTALLSHWLDAGIILGVVVLNALIGFIQEGKAEKALDAIRGMLSHQASVVRNKKRVLLPADRVVPGDIVFLQSGDKVPADMRLFKVRDLRIDESALTGESVPVEKTVLPVEKDKTIGDRTCLAFSGAFVTYGQGQGVVVGSGDDTEIGRISSMLARVSPLTTRLLKQISGFGRQLTVAIVSIAVATFLFGMFVQSYSFVDLFLASVGLFVAAIPEGLPAIISITLAIGVQAMARRKAIIRRLPAVETLGSVTVICSDKTGTLTRNEMTVKMVVTANNAFDVSGVGYDPHGDFSLNNKEASLSEYPEITEMSRAALLCNDAVLNEVKGKWSMQGDPTEGALVVLAKKTGLDYAFENENLPRIDTIPFESERRFMATLHHDHAGHQFIYLKGAPERVLDLCAHQRCYGEEKIINISYWQDKIQEIASRGQRVIAVAFKTVEREKRQINFADVEGSMTLLGFFGIIDPPSEEAMQAIKQCQSAGIRVKMITGDHALTALAIGDQLGIGDGKRALIGKELESYTDEELSLKVKTVDVFARVSPEHKLRLVQALQRNGDVVAMTGDGVNDAPALKRADVGVAMGIKGTEVSKEASEMVLMDDNFSSIVSAIEEGRRVYDNIKKSITFILPTNVAEAGMIIVAILSGRMLPITPIQILWVNMITAVTLSLSLAFEQTERGTMNKPPRNPCEPILSLFLVWRIFFVSFIIVLGTFGFFLWDRLHSATIEESRTVAVNTLVMFEVFYLFNIRYLKRSVLSVKGLLGNRYILIAVAITVGVQLLFTYAPPMQRIFETASITGKNWMFIVIIASSVFLLVELEKIVIKKKNNRKE
ncbi:MAG: cation-transporting P-type ATPase [Candidatus Brocadiaceae bacterium]|nr:cation-transporting P-type ATPase [Candidatus Brocadiaceae bacterium]